MKYHVLVEGTHYEVQVERRDGGFDVTCGGETNHVDVATLRDGLAYSVLVDERSVDVTTEENGDGLDLLVAGSRYSTEVLGEREWLARSIQADGDDGDTRVTAVMTGIVNDVLVAVGDPVTKGQVLFILEAMKMENEVRAEVDGTVAAVHTQAGATVELGDVIIELE